MDQLPEDDVGMCDMALADAHVTDCHVTGNLLLKRLLVAIPQTIQTRNDIVMLTSSLKAENPEELMAMEQALEDWEAPSGNIILHRTLLFVSNSLENLAVGRFVKSLLAFFRRFHQYCPTQCQAVDWMRCKDYISRFHYVCELQIITTQEAENPDEVVKMLKTWACKRSTHLEKIVLWTGVGDCVEYRDFHMLPSPGVGRQFTAP
jgi:hypothetical protein